MTLEGETAGEGLSRHGYGRRESDVTDLKGGTAWRIRIDLELDTDFPTRMAGKRPGTSRPRFGEIGLEEGLLHTRAGASALLKFESDSLIPAVFDDSKLT